VLLVGWGESQQQSVPSPETPPAEPVAEVPAQPSSPSPETKPVEPVAEAAQPEPPTAKAPDISIHAAARQGKIEAVKQHLTDGVGVNAKSERGRTPLHSAAREGHKEVIELLIAKGADVNAKDDDGGTPLDWAIVNDETETADLLRKHGGKTAEELEEIFHAIRRRPRSSQ
jgi:ankyrin repeat protein